MSHLIGGFTRRMNSKSFIKVAKAIGFAVYGIFLLYRYGYLKMDIDNDVFLYLAIIYGVFGIIEYSITKDDK